MLQLAELSKRYNIGLNIDAEESERLEISLELLERLCFEPSLADWKGIGFVIQALSKALLQRGRLCGRSGKTQSKTFDDSSGQRCVLG